MKSELSTELEFVNSELKIGQCQDCIENLEINKFNESVYTEVNRYLDEVLKPHYRNIVEKNILAVGHDTKSLKASDEAYASVHPCCQYRDSDVIEDHDNGEGN